MNEDTTFNGFNDPEFTDNSLLRTYTQVGSCAVGQRRTEKLKQTLRAKLEREALEREQRLENLFTRSFRSLFKGH